MLQINLKIEGIPAILWGEPSDKIFISVHGNMSSKDDDSIVIFAEEAIDKGYQVLSFDLPEHGDRKGEGYDCKVQNCVSDLTVIVEYVKTISSNISVFACSMGSYFSLLAYRDLSLKQCLFLSPVLNMERIINNMMTWFNVSEDRLKAEKEIETPIGQTLYWDYYCYVKSHPIDTWNQPTAILYGSIDNLSEFNVVSEFAKRYHCKLDVLEDGEHYFHTVEQLHYFRQWLKDNISVF
ncbi:alpha/beta hydrolase [Desulfosporosinus nitroreducens]|uniref:alpha/beta hydrolase n=1 Tax=Desulfosporosinus nitroreducens TaxID=2018668 RepID=UPI00207C4951|nr:alpha/beta hydrolase [Desulfosporosinus nitroreducens]MCO1602005.1 alpha/beta hydrolase [Desulfosporosinus nitroreducens]